VARGNEGRIMDVFLDNFERWLDGTSLKNEVKR